MPAATKLSISSTIPDSATPVLVPIFVQNIPIRISAVPSSCLLIASCGRTSEAGIECVSHCIASRLLCLALAPGEPALDRQSSTRQRHQAGLSQRLWTLWQPTHPSRAEGPGPRGKPWPYRAIDAPSRHQGHHGAATPGTDHRQPPRSADRPEPARAELHSLQAINALFVRAEQLHVLFPVEMQKRNFVVSIACPPPHPSLRYSAVSVLRLSQNFPQRGGVSEKSQKRAKNFGRRAK